MTRDVLTPFLDDLLHQGRAVIAPGIANDSPAAREFLGSAYAAYQLSIAGPQIAFDADVAIKAGVIVRSTCIALVDRGERPDSLAPQLRMQGVPKAPAHHLSADLTLRFLPQVLRRARAIDPNDPLIGLIETLLQAWPLSGVMADIESGPTAPLDFHNHPGLCLLYVERLAHHDRQTWYPEGVAGEYWELVHDT